MNEVRKKYELINGNPVSTKEASLETDSILVEAEAGTTGFKFGKEGEADTYIRIEGADDTRIHTRILRGDDGFPDGVEFAAHGNDELILLIAALVFVAKQLLEQVVEEDE